ncbi:MAG: aldehyde dehydrogenase family protein [Planctomycetes bacterium]|nr:aldehyde dehydrogenase family protein [Planctomycetota bacterium]MBI3847734.1 aldehyde dehydrogenase family protein [Planctomycetota bacterium]
MSEADAHTRARRVPLFLAGERRESSAWLPVRDPFSNSIVAEVASADAAILDEAVSHAVRAFETMRRLPAYERAAILSRAAATLTAHRDEIAATISLEAGKPIRDARTEASRAAMTFQVAAEEAKRIGGDVLPLDQHEAANNRLGLVRRFPIGPILGITPFNFPLNLVAHKVAPAIASGNTIVLKPAIPTPLTALRLADILADAGLPAGALSVVPCANVLAETLVRDPRFRMVSFTGSAAVGWRLKEISGKKRVTLELGGNAAVIVHDDADIDLAVERCAFGAFYYSGQVCLSVQRILVQARVYAEFRDRLVARARRLRLGDPRDEATDVGPLIDDSAVAKVTSWVAEAESKGARALTAGDTVGRIVPPTILEGVDPKLRVSCCEVFGPVVCVAPYETFDEALAKANDSDFGLQGGLFTRDLDRVMRAYERFEVGALIVNDAPTFRVDSMPYGGVKESGLGREGLRYAIEEMTEPRLLVLRTMG